ncbi:hypothetical protein AM1_4004 [Acaryochloris marina MBIC11017]|uniref:Uncharacterized protein n=1 Tax=Acaryochloris marina (strain MBIC 11017) TaxID=329726 RepID=B0C9H4_ACAM1|nr:hypothetical protein AM1_4004 [Acaryochloris marina MBIC11017]
MLYDGVKIFMPIWQHDFILPSYSNFSNELIKVFSFSLK